MKSMKMHKWLFPVALAALSLLAGCKKSGEEVKRYMDGRLTLSFPLYVEAGFSKTFCIDTLMTVKRSDGGPIGYYFRNSDTNVGDTLVTVDGRIDHQYYTVTVPDKMKNMSVSLFAFAPKEANYYDASTSALFTIVKPGLDGNGTITGFEAGSSPLMTDERDGKQYYTVEAGGHTWMRHNLAWAGAGLAYERSEVMTDIVGRFYTWEEAQTACPEGWRLPSDADWTALDPGAEAGKDMPGFAGKLMVDTYFNGVKMWEYFKNVHISDDFGLSVMPAGYASVGEDGATDFGGLFDYAAFWTSDSTDGMGVIRYIYQGSDIFYRGRMSQTEFAASVRCVKQ